MRTKYFKPMLKRFRCMVETWGGGSKYKHRASAQSELILRGDVRGSYNRFIV